MHTANVLLSYRAHRVTFQCHWVQQEGTYLQAFKHYMDSRQNEKWLLDEATEGKTPAAKRQPPLGDKVQATSDTEESAVSRAAIVAQVKQLRLPVPCPLPTNFTKQVTNAIKNNQLKGVMKTRLLRQAAVFYWGLVSTAHTQDEYVTMAMTVWKFSAAKGQEAYQWSILGE